MPESTAERQGRILERLQAQQRVTIGEMTAYLGVSAMTVHRDLDKLAARGLLVKSRGGASLPHHPASMSGTTRCALCGTSAQSRTAFIVGRGEDDQVHACCAHCGLLLLGQQPAARWALTADFIGGRMVNVREATYVVESRVAICCSPSILTFSCPRDARSFQRGFGGTVMDFARVQDHLAARASLAAAA